MKTCFLLLCLCAAAVAFTPSALKLHATPGLRAAGSGHQRASLGLKMVTPGSAGARVLVSAGAKTVATTGILVATPPTAHSSPGHLTA